MIISEIYLLVILSFIFTLWLSLIFMTVIKKKKYGIEIKNMLFKLPVSGMLLVLLLNSEDKVMQYLFGGISGLLLFVFALVVVKNFKEVD